MAKIYLKKSTDIGSIPSEYNGNASSGFIPYVIAEIAPKRYPFALSFIDNRIYIV